MTDAPVRQWPEGHCQVRVGDNGDMTDCGTTVVEGSKFCAKHDAQAPHTQCPKCTLVKRSARIRRYREQLGGHCEHCGTHYSTETLASMLHDYKNALVVAEGEAAWAREQIAGLQALVKT